MQNLKMADSPSAQKSEKKDSELVINVTRKLKISICKPLIPLKMALTFWFTASYGLTSYLALFFKERGATVEEISFIYLTAYLSQFIISTACGVISDKIGRPVYMTMLSMLLAGTLACCLTFIPKISEMTDENQSISSLYCGETEYSQLDINHTCDKALIVKPCEELCALECCKNVSISLMDKSVNNSLFRYQNDSEYSFNWCVRDSKTVFFTNDTPSLCRAYQKTCTATCLEYKSATSDRKNRVLVFIAFAILFITFDENTYRFLDILANHMANTFGAEFGRQIFWSNVGALVGPSLIAVIIQQTSPFENEPKYEGSLYFYATVALTTTVIVFVLDVGKVEPSQEMSRAVVKLFKNLEFLFFVFILLVVGGTWGFLMNFHNLVLADIGTPIVMMGLLDTFSSLCGLPVLITGKWLTNKIGHTNVFSMALLGYFFKCIGYSFIRVAWPVFFLELFMIFSYHLLWIATIDFCTKIGPDDLKGTMVMLAGTVHFSLGRACGSFAGGLLMSAYGTSIAFQIVGAANGSTFLLYSLYRLLRSRRIKKVDIS